MARVTDAQPPACPFCRSSIDRPRELEPKRLGDFAYGSCRCGAVYVYDVTGHNLGAALVEAMMLACADDMDLMWNLLPEEDYREARIDSYDMDSHLVFLSGRTREGDKVKGVLTFIRLKEEIAEAIKERREDKFAAYGLDSRHYEPQRLEMVQPLEPRRYSKRQVARTVSEWDRDAIVEMARRDSLLLNKIQRLLYSPDPELRWKAVKAIGVASGVINQFRPGQVGDLLRRLLFASTDSAAANWGSIESIGEIIRHNPKIYGTFVGQLMALLRHEESRAAVLWAVGRISEKAPDLIRGSAFFAVFDLLDSQDPAVRGHAAWALGRMGIKGAEKALARLCEDGEEFELYDGETLSLAKVGDVAKESLALLKGEEMVEKQEKDVSGQEQDEFKKAAKLYMEGDMLLARGMSLDAMEKLQEALAIFESLGKEREVANTCDKLGDVHILRGNFKNAISMYQRALAICEKRDDPVSALILLEKVTDVYKKDNRYESALPYYMHALELAEKLKEAGRACLYLTAIGDIYQRQGKVGDALDAYRLALKISKGMGARERVKILEEGIARIEASLAKE